MLDMFRKVVDTLFPNLPAERVVTQLKKLKEEVLQHNIPVYRNLYEQKTFIKRNPYASKFGKVTNDIMMRGKYGKSIKGHLNATDVVYMVMADLPAKIDYLIEHCERHMGKVVVKENITYSQATLIQIAEVIDFMLVYSRRYLNQLLVEETRLLPDARNTEGYSVAVVKWLEVHVTSFTTALEAFSGGLDDFIKNLKVIPDITIEKDPELESAVVAHAGVSRVDPFRLGFIPYTRNPFYMFGASRIESTHDRIEASRTERELVGLRLQNLLMKRDQGESNAHLENMINELQNRLQKIDIRINKDEHSFDEYNQRD